MPQNDSRKDIDSIACITSFGKNSVMESDDEPRPLFPEAVQERFGKRILVRVTAFRHRLIDEDNLCEKYHVDLLRYAGIIPGDEPEKVKIEVYQKKVPTSEKEEVLIEVYQ